MSPGTSLVLPGRFVAAVFDVDGLLVATEPVWAAAEAALLARHGHVYTDDDRLATIGRSVDASIAVYGRRIGVPEKDLPELREELVKAFRAQLASVEALPGARRLIESLTGRMRLAVASSSPRSIVGDALAVTGMAGAFEAIVSGDDVASQKPAPDAYLLACRSLGVDPRDAVAFEDSEPGIRSAVRAGVYCVAVPSDPAVDVSAADLVLPTLEAVVVEARRWLDHDRAAAPPSAASDEPPP
jgi:HAD superfamily hydrolase (TIGR01509 family)